MAGETGNIAAIAELISDEIFGEFGWKTCGPYNENWPCLYKNVHEKSTHPTDVVFWYPHPYFNRNVYINCDLKSYKAQSITKASVFGAISSLIKATECAQVSPEWQDRHTFQGHNSEIVSMLFIYNHDGAHDKKFDEYFDNLSKDDFKMRKGCKVYIFNPETICYLKTITNDLKTLRGDKLLTDKGTYSFYYPEIYFKKLARDENRTATIETLLGPWQIIKYKKDPNSHGLIVYMRTSGTNIYEFVYFIDYLFRYQLINNVDDITIRIPFADNMAAANLEKAKQHYEFVLGEDSDISERLSKIKFKQLTTVFTQYSTIEIGMRNAS